MHDQYPKRATSSGCRGTKAGKGKLTLRGKIYVKGKLVSESVATDNEQEHSFRDKLEKCLTGVCAGLDIPVPLWLKKNTRELAIFKKTFFTSEQFIEKVWFDKLEIILSGSEY